MSLPCWIPYKAVVPNHGPFALIVLQVSNNSASRRGEISTCSPRYGLFPAAIWGREIRTKRLPKDWPFGGAKGHLALMYMMYMEYLEGGRIFQDCQLRPRSREECEHMLGTPRVHVYTEEVVM